MNVPRVLISLLVLSLPSVAAGHKLEPCQGSRSRVRNLESQAITKVEASYPNERGVHVRGTVTVLIKVNRRGTVVSAHAICGHPLLVASSVAAAIQWKFQPRRVNGRVTNNVGVITFDFKPTESSSVRAAKSL